MTTISQPVAETSAFEIVRISVPTPFLVGPVNAYLILSEIPTLVDCGPLTEEAWEALMEGIKGAGCRLDQLSRLVLTHSHIDHAGLAGRLQRASGCQVLAHAVDHAALSDGSGAWTSTVVDFLVEACRRAGTPVSVLLEMERQLLSHGQYREPVDVVTALGEGEVLLFPEGRLEVLHTPGHSHGSLCLWEPGEKILLSGDTLIPHISSNALLAPGLEGFRDKSLLKYLHSLERLAGMELASVLPGHGVPMGSPDVLIRDRISFSDRRAERICQLVAEGLDSPWAIAHRMFPTSEPTFAFLPVSEVVGHLDLLVSKKAVCFQDGDAQWAVHPV